MVIEGVNYVHMGDGVECSMSACISMLLDYYGIENDPAYISELFGETFMSPEFKEWHLHSLDSRKFEESDMLTCASYLISSAYAPMRADVIETKLSSIHLSYLKRKIPVLVTGSFPFLSGRVSSTVLLKGYVSDYFVVNDPRGNANSGYRDRYGENLLYTATDLSSWAVKSSKVYILRVI